MLELVLASSSRYREHLLGRLHLPFSVSHPRVDETPLSGEPPGALVRRLAEAKARAVAGDHPEALVIGSDQVAVIDGAVIGKPGGHEAAVAQLSRVSGRRLTFLTSVCLLNARTGRMQTDAVSVAVVFRDLSRADIERYLSRERPYDCAGAFKSEGLGIALVSRFEGHDPSALIGLPLIRLIDMLRGEQVVLP